MLGYLFNPRAGAALYNLAHTLTLPLTLLLVSYATHHPLALNISLIWTAHIAADRLLGYGLKYPTFFKDTHLQHIPTTATPLDSPTGNPQKYFQKVTFFRARKTTIQTTTKSHTLTTNSPQETTTQSREISKTPRKIYDSPPKINPEQKPPVRQ